MQLKGKDKKKNRWIFFTLYEISFLRNFLGFPGCSLVRSGCMKQDLPHESRSLERVMFRVEIMKSPQHSSVTGPNADTDR